MKHVAVFCSDQTASYAFGPEHPFGPDRQQAFLDELHRRGLDQHVLMLPSRPATRVQAERFHGSDYLDFVRDRCAREGGYLDFGDSPALPHIHDAGLAVVGAALRATEMLVERSIAAAFLPIGGLHHAGRQHAAGFCAFNDIGVVVDTLRAQYGVRRILYVDIDAHHGDGVFYAFEDDPDLWIVDFHQSPLYPGTGLASETGKGAAAGSKRNIPLAPGSGTDEFRNAWTDAESFMAAAQPEFIILQCGADSIAGDPLADLRLEALDHGFAAARLLDLASEHCPGRLLALGGGGYNRANLAAAWTEVVAALLGRQ